MKNGPYELIVPPADYPGKLYRGRYAYEHQVVYWQNTGRTIVPGELVHHLNGNKRDNRFENLELLSIRSHGAHHGRERGRKMRLLECFHCGIFFVRRNNGVPKDQLRFFCCRSHQVSTQQLERIR